MVGGLAVQFWTEGEYVTHDIDVALPSTVDVEERLRALGFEREGRHWRYNDLFLEMPVDFLDRRLSVVEVEVESGQRVGILSLEDSLIFRLHKFASNGHPEATAQAVFMLMHPDLDDDRLTRRIEEEDLSAALRAVREVATRRLRGEDVESHHIHDLHRRFLLERYGSSGH